MKTTPELIANIRTSLREQLSLLADVEAQWEYERRVPIANVPAELFCGWFDDAYHLQSPAFQAAFSRSELDALAEFNVLFAAVGAELPEPLPRLCELQALPAWGRVVSGASKALHSLSGRIV